jgi:hypothetical protein
MSESTSTLAALQTPDEYRRNFVAHIYPSLQSFDWYLRNNKRELIEAGAVVSLAGRTFIEPGAMERAMLEIGRRQAVHPLLGRIVGPRAKKADPVVEHG